MTTELPLPLISVDGPPAECGAAYGRRAADLIAANIAAYADRFAVRAGLTTATVRRAGAAFRAATHAYQPRIGAMLDGVAAGAGVAVEDLYALNGRTELLYGTVAEECTTIGVLDRRSARGHTLLAQNWDWHPAQQPYTVLLATRDENGFEVLTLAEAGMVAKAGLNSAGVGLCVNVLTSDRDGRPGGVPYHVLLRAALEADCLSLALRAVCRMPRSASVNLMLGQACAEPGGGELVDLELVPGDLGVLNPVDGLLTHANHIETRLPVRDTFADFGGSSYFRAARVARLLPGGPVAEADIARVLADHASYPHAICRHVDERDSADERSASLYSLILDLDERRLSIAAGPPCNSAYHDVDLGVVGVDSRDLSPHYS
jgi:isopenicillin-N N-acyltransferase like protein